MRSKKFSVKNEVTLKVGRTSERHTIRKGDEVIVSWDEHNRPLISVGPFRRQRASVKLTCKLLGIQMPTMEDLEEWTYDSVCESVYGHNVEPDGHDEEGSPSWLLALGLM